MPSIRRLFASLLACLLLPVAAGAQAALTPHQRAAREIYEQLVEINTVDSVGSVTAAVEAMAARFREAGFPAADIHVVVPPSQPTKGNLVVRYRGRGGPLKPVLLLAHLDVVAALRSDWSRDPFELQEANGFFYGRGTSDDKSMAAMFVANLLRYKKEGYTPSRDLILALTADEEGGGSNGVTYLLQNHRALIDAAYAINEGGGGTLAPNGTTPVFHSIQAAEKVYTDFTLTARNPGGHSSVPRPDNAINQLAVALVNVSKYTFPVALNSVTRPFFTETAKVERPELSVAMRTIAANPADSAAAAIISKDPRYSSMLRTSCVATRLSGGHANNALPQTATANVNCRIAPTSSPDDVKAALVKAIGDTGVVVSSRAEGRGGVAPDLIDPALLASVTVLTKQMWGAIPVIPTMSTGATDGRPLRAAGIPTFGVSGIFSVPGETNPHGRDEKLRTRSFYEGLDFLYQLVKQVSGTIAM